MTGAEGGTSFRGSQPPSKGPTNAFPRDPGITNIVARPDIRQYGQDQPGDGDTDDPYPGGPTPSLGVPGDG